MRAVVELMRSAMFLQKNVSKSVKNERICGSYFVLQTTWKTIEDAQKEENKEGEMPRHQKRKLCLKFKQTRMVEHQKRSYGNEGGLYRQACLLNRRKAKPLRKSSATLVIGSSPEIAEQKCPPFEKQGVPVE